MRIARVFHAQTQSPIVALERDGALYDVAELDRHFGTRYAPERLPHASDFHTRVIALSCAGLAELDEALRAGRRPRDARLLPGSFLWLAPCATDRALYVQMGPYARLTEEPSYAIGNARALVGHDATVPFPPREEEPDVELGLAAILGEDLQRATAEQADKAILGYAVLGAWVARGEQRRLGTAPWPETARTSDFAVQLGPVLITRDEIGDVASLGARLRIGDQALPCSNVGAWPFHVAESIAFVSEHVELHAGDVIGAGCLGSGSARAQGRRIEYGQSVEIAIDRLGRVGGRPLRGPDAVDWRRH
jgi:2-keto-4-pentenoate hydratase/2-oxohepta-3-ene-1,7-dioic acid hydratase in catechol pathway